MSPQVIPVCTVMLMIILCGPCTAMASTTEDKRTSCEAEQSKIDGKATVTCHFGQDIGLTKHNVDVQFYPLSTNEPVSMLSCIWLARDPDKPKCFTHTGCTLLTELNDTLSIELNKTAMDLKGRYVCQLVPDDGIPVQPCNLLENDDKPAQEDLVMQTNETVTSSYDLKCPAEETSTQQDVFAVVAVTVATISIIVNFVFLAVCVWHRRRYNLGSKSQDVVSCTSDETKSFTSST